MPVIAAVIGGGALLASSVISSSQSASNVSSANATNIRLQREQRDWEERMANTAHRREMKDLQAAGLNPILTATGGAGAATPNVGAPSVTPEPPISGGDFVSGASSAYMARLQAKKLEEEIKVAHEVYLKTAEETEIAGNEKAMSNQKKLWQFENIGKLQDAWEAELMLPQHTAQGLALDNYGKPVNIETARQQLKNLVQQHNIGQSAEAKAKIEAEIDRSSIGEVLRWIDRLSKSVRGAR